MGLIVSIYRCDYDSVLNHFNGFSMLTVVNVNGPFHPDVHRPAAILMQGPGGSPRHQILVPAEWDEEQQKYIELRKPGACRMDGGTIADCSDGRWTKASQERPVRIHDRFEEN